MKKKVKKFVRKKKKYYIYGTGNTIAYIFEIGLTFLITSLFGTWYMTSFAFALVVGTMLLFFFHRNYTFKRKSRIEERFLGFMIFTIVAIAMTWLAVLGLTSYFGINYLLAIVVVRPFTTFFNYAATDRIVFQ